MKYAEIVVNTPLATLTTATQIFTYSIPPHLSQSLARGQLVWVPFGTRRLQGIVIGLSDTSPVNQTKDIDQIVDERPFLSPSQIELAHWIAETYLCPLNAAIQLMLPAGITQQNERIIALNPNVPCDQLKPRQAELVQLLSTGGEVKVNELARELRSAVKPLARRGIIVERSVVAPPRAKPKRVRFVRLLSEAKLVQLVPPAAREQAAALEFLARWENGALIAKAVCKSAPCSPQALTVLAARQLIELTPAQVTYSLTGHDAADVLARSKAQSRILEFMRARGAPVSAKELVSATRAVKTTLDALVTKGYLERSETESTVVLKITPSDALEQARALRTVPRYAAVVDLLRREPAPMWISAVYAATSTTRADLLKLQEAGVIELEEEEVWRDSLASRTFDAVEPPQLTPEQQHVLEPILASLPAASDSERQAPPQKPTVFLLHGVTGSGKTEIYLRALKETLARGQQGIVLVPEISLTPQTIRRFGARFPNRIAVLHSRLSEGERYDTWRRCRNGLVSVVVGSRSALFAPLPRLGLIVIDEEHDSAYKQESVPHYHAREVALELAKLTGATVVLGSATPELETYYRAARGKFTLLELPQRIMGHRETIESEASQYALTSARLAVHELQQKNSNARYLDLPPVQIVDLRAELKAGNRSIFSRVLQREMARVLAAHEQVILFLNRRGSATFVLCRDCGLVLKCPRCNSPMTYHVADTSFSNGIKDQLVCHRCNRRERVPVRCPNCNSTRIRYFGTGTQKVEEEIRTLFPEAHTLRWDFDVTRGKDSHEAILEQFIQHRADILIGTQMIAKGLDLPLVTLVGVISADTSLNLPDFRAGERTFQLLTQVAGRAGRSILGGKVILQTYNPEHYAIQSASRHDYEEFYEREIDFRREQRYPPFSRLVRLMLSHANEQRCRDAAAELHRKLRVEIARRGLPALDLIGPAPAFFHRIRGEYRYQLILRGTDPGVLLRDLALPLGWRVDVDPVSLL